ncbi:MAG: PaaI family thioesterase, partial [Smithellaceae bacterium]|nr:PaaI family thioesterase [Smithellaceae bacterium]
LEFTEEIWRRSQFIKLLGVTIEKLEHGCCQSQLKIKDSFLNVHNTVHGGVIYSMVDISMGVAVYSTLKKDDETVTVEIKINYLKPAKTKSLFCEARVIQKGKNIVVLEAEVRSESNLIAKAQGTFSIFKLEHHLS